MEDTDYILNVYTSMKLYKTSNKPDNKHRDKSVLNIQTKWYFVTNFLIQKSSHSKTNKTWFNNFRPTETLCFFFYMAPGDIIQIMVGNELHFRGWR